MAILITLCRAVVIIGADRLLSAYKLLDGTSGPRGGTDLTQRLCTLSGWSNGMRPQDIFLGRQGGGTLYMRQKAGRGLQIVWRGGCDRNSQLPSNYFQPFVSLETPTFGENMLPAGIWKILSVLLGTRRGQNMAEFHPVSCREKHSVGLSKGLFQRMEWAVLLFFFPFWFLAFVCKGRFSASRMPREDTLRPEARHWDGAAAT